MPISVWAFSVIVKTSRSFVSRTLPPLNTLSLLQSLCAGSAVSRRQNLQSGWDSCDTCSTTWQLTAGTGTWHAGAGASEDLRGEAGAGAREPRGDRAGDLGPCGHSPPITFSNVAPNIFRITRSRYVVCITGHTMQIM